jgi:hypothetical protein
MLKLTLHTSGAAFDDGSEEVARILRELADRIKAGRTSGRLFDLNGNACGNWAFDKADNNA